MATVDRPFDEEADIRGLAQAGGERSLYDVVKRALDLLVAIPALVLALPIIVLIGVAIRIDSPGPIVFRQQRVGRNGVPFRFYKFRTMYVDARERFPHLYRYQYDQETIRTMKFKLIDDPRLTRLGRYLRKTSLDELPNLLNVITGDVSLVGPRPEIPEMLPYYEGWQLAKFSVKPGVTGLAQISGRGLLSFQDTIAADVEYVAGRGIGLDLSIILSTVIEVIRRQGAF